MTKKRQNLTFLSNLEIVTLMYQCSKSKNRSDKDFAKDCRNELAMRKQEQNYQLDPQEDADFGWAMGLTN